MSITRLVKGSAPSLLQTEKGNEVVDAINSLIESEGEDPIDVRFESASGSFPAKMIVSIDPDALGGDGVPEGFEETAVVICDRATNTATSGTILFNAD